MSSYYDKLTLNSLHFKKKRGGQHDIGVEPEAIIPPAGEIRLLGNRHKQCAYYQVGKYEIFLHYFINICFEVFPKEALESNIY
jgi:hypothetical protein